MLIPDFKALWAVVLTLMYPKPWTVNPKIKHPTESTLHIGRYKHALVPKQNFHPKSQDEATDSNHKSTLHRMPQTDYFNKPRAMDRMYTSTEVGAKLQLQEWHKHRNSIPCACKFQRKTWSMDTTRQLSTPGFIFPKRPSPTQTLSKYVE